MYMRAWRSFSSPAPTRSAILPYTQSIMGERCAVTRASPEVNLPSRVPPDGDATFGVGREVGVEEATFGGHTVSSMSAEQGVRRRPPVAPSARTAVRSFWVGGQDDRGAHR